MIFRYRSLGNLLAVVVVAAAVTSSVVKAQTDDSCSLCPAGSTLGKPDQSLAVYDASCGELQQLLGVLGSGGSTQACTELVSNIPFVDIPSYCGCTGVTPPSVCSNICNTVGDEPARINYETTVELPGLDFEVNCRDAAGFANYLTVPEACLLINEICCFEDDDGDGEPDDPFEDIIGDGSGTECDVCSDGSDVGLPEKDLFLGEITCGQLQEAANNPDAVDTGGINVCGTIGTLGPFLDLESWCGCPGKDTAGTGICPVCADGGSVSSSSSASIDFLGATLSCTDAAEAAKYLKSESVCRELVGLFDAICCTDNVDVDTTPEVDETTEGTATAAPTTTPPAVQTDVPTTAPVTITNAPTLANPPTSPPTAIADETVVTDAPTVEATTAVTDPVTEETPDVVEDVEDAAATATPTDSPVTTEEEEESEGGDGDQEEDTPPPTPPAAGEDGGDDGDEDSDSDRETPPDSFSSAYISVYNTGSMIISAAIMIIAMSCI